MRGGYYLMARGWMDHPAIATNEPFTRREAWVWLIENAAFRDTRLNVFGKTINVQRGQLCRSYRDLAASWGWSLGSVQRYVTRLETDTLIDTLPDTKRLLITICNYDKYQSPWENGDTPSDTEQNTNLIQQRYTSDTQKKEGKEGKQEEVSSLRSLTPPEGAQAIAEIAQIATATATAAAVEGPAEAELPGLLGPISYRQTAAGKPERPDPIARRLPEDWMPSQDDIAYANDRGLDAAAVAEDFRGWWLAKGGKDARKTNWTLTWQGWCRRDAERKKMRGKSTHRADPAKPATPRQIPEHAGGWVVAAVIEQCNSITNCYGEGCWPGFDLAIADALEAGAHPDWHIFPIMRDIQRRGNWREIGSARFFTAAIETRRNKGVAA